MKFPSGEWERFNLTELSQMKCLKEAEPIPLEDFSSRHHENGDSENGNSNNYRKWNNSIPPKKDREPDPVETENPDNTEHHQDNSENHTEGN